MDAQQIIDYLKKLQYDVDKGFADRIDCAMSDRKVDELEKKCLIAMNAINDTIALIKQRESI